MSSEVAANMAAIERRVKRLRKCKDLANGSAYLRFGFFDPDLERTSLNVVGRYFAVVGHSLKLRMEILRRSRPDLELPSAFARPTAGGGATERKSDEQLQLFDEKDLLRHQAR